MWPLNRPKRKKLFVQSLGKQYPQTPDIAELQTQQYKLLFVADDMMSPHKNYSLIEKHSNRVSRGFTQDGFEYRIGRTTGRGLPFHDKQGLKVKGELHAVATEVIPALDKHYDNGVQFARVRVNILVTNRDHQLMSIGSEEFIRNLPPGMVRTVPELGLRHYLSNQMVCILKADMYVALRAYWLQDPKTFPTVPPQYPKEPLVWLPRYYRYPIEINRRNK